MIKAVLFDIDGVLIDSRQANIAYYQKLIQLAGYPPPSSDEILHHYHLTLYDSVKYFARLEDAAAIQAIVDLGLQMPYPKELAQVPKGAKPALTRLSRDYQLGLVSSRVKKGIDDFFDIFGRDINFDVAISFDDCTHPKPHPEPLVIAIDRLGIGPEEAVYIGDAPSDVQAAKAAHIKSILYSDQKTIPADYYFKTFNQLPRLIRSIETSS